MTETTTETADTEARESGLLRRTFAADVSAGDGRTVDARIVPYGEKITHADGFGGVPVGVPYTEEWVPGAFTGQLRAPNRVLVNFEHQEGIGGIVGHGKALVERNDGLYGSFKLHDTPDGDKALMLVREGVLAGISLEVPMRTVKSVKTVAGVVQRVKARLVGVALCRHAAYTGAVVLAVREAAQIIDEELLAPPLDPEAVERCRRLGIQLPQRYQETHPADNGHPGETGTSEAAPVQATQT